jgi:hypothetical protein
MTNLYEAHRNWRTRPPDERYATLAEMYNEAHARRVLSAVSEVSLQTLGIEAGDDSIRLVGKQFCAQPTHWSFGQVGALLGLPTEWLRSAPAQLVADSVAFGCSQGTREQLKFLWYIPEARDQAGLLRAATTTTYKHLWDDDVIQLLMELSVNETTMKRPPAATDALYPSGYYMSDRDLWVFMVSQAHPIANGELSRGLFCWNTEVQGGYLQSFGMKAFLHQGVCGNHIVMGTSTLFEFKAIHVGDIYGRVHRMATAAASHYLNSSVRSEELQVAAAKKLVIGKTDPDAVEWLNARGITQAAAKEALAAANAAGGNPYTLWAVVTALTRLNQRQSWMGDRAKADFQAGRLLQEVEV